MTLLEKIQALPPDLQQEVEDFIEFITVKRRRQVSSADDESIFWQGVGQQSLAAIWDSDEDDVYGQLLET